MDGLGLREIRWQKPDVQDAVIHLQIIASIEKCPISIKDTVFTYKYCHGDIRHAIMLLQLASVNRDRLATAAFALADSAAEAGLSIDGARNRAEAPHSAMPCVPSSGRLPCTVAVARGPICLSQFGLESQVLPVGTFGAGTVLKSRAGAASTCRTLESSDCMIDLLFNTHWESETQQTSQDTGPKCGMDTVMSMVQRADAISLASCLLEVPSPHLI